MAKPRAPGGAEGKGFAGDVDTLTRGAAIFFRTTPGKLKKQPNCTIPSDRVLVQ